MSFIGAFNGAVYASYRQKAAIAILRERIQRGEKLEPHQIRAAIRYGLIKFFDK